MNGKKKRGILKKVSAISPLAVIIAMVILFGMSAVSVAEDAPIIDKIAITEPEDGSVTNESSICIRGIVNGTIDNTSIESMILFITVIHNDENLDPKQELNVTVSNGTFDSEFEYKDVKLDDDENIFKVNAETGEPSKPSKQSEQVTVTKSSPLPQHPATTDEEGGAEEKGDEEGSPYFAWILVGAIVAVSFLIFYIFETLFKRKSDYADLYGWIVGIIFAITASILAFKYFDDFGLINAIAAGLLSIGLPLLYLLIEMKVGGTKKEVGELKSENLSPGFYDYFSINFKVFDEKTKQPIPDARISVIKSGSSMPDFFKPTDPGSYGHKLERGEYDYKIEPDGEYKPRSGKFSVEGSKTIPIPLSKRTGNLAVQVKDRETGNPVPGLTVSVSGVEKKTDEQGKALFSGVIIGAKEINVDEIKGVYSSETKTCEIIEDTTNEVTVSIKSFLRIPIDKERKLSALRNQLQDNYRRVSTYDPCIPSYYRSIVDNLVNLVNGMVRNPMLFVGSKNNPGELIGHLIDAIDTASREIIEVMTSKRNLDVYSAAMKLEKAEVRATPVEFADSRVASYIRDSDDFYNSYYHTAQSKLFEIDTDITKKTSEMNVLPVSGLWRVARTVLNETSAGSAETYVAKKGAMLLVADILLDYTGGMSKDAKIIERLKIMVI